MSVPLHRKLLTFFETVTYLADIENSGDVAAFEPSRKNKPSEMLIAIVLFLRKLSIRGISTRSDIWSSVEEHVYSLGPFYRTWKGWETKKHPKTSQIVSERYSLATVKNVVCPGRNDLLS